MKKRALGFLIVITLISLASCDSKTEQTNTNSIPTELIEEHEYFITKTQFNSSQMELGELELREFHEIVKANGMFDVPPENRATISTYFGGTVNNLVLLPGEFVKKGQTLFTLENPNFVELQQEFLEAQGQIAFLKTDYERQKNLIQGNVTSQKNYLKAESDFNVMSVKLEALSKKLSLMGINPTTLSVQNIRTIINVNSPIDGFVTEVNITRGAYLNPSQTALTIIDTDHLHLELRIFEKDLPNVAVGQAIQFKLQAGNSKEYKASIHLVNKIVDLESRTIDIHGHLLDEKLASKFNPGMYVEADILTSSISKIAIAQDALVEVDNAYYVLVLSSSSNEGFSFEKKKVEIGASNTGFVEILNTQDFNKNTEILIKGAFNLITD